MPQTVAQADYHVELVVDESSGSTQCAMTTITHNHGSCLELAVIRRRDSMESCFMGSRLGESTN